MYKLKSHYLSRNYTLQNHSFLKNRNNRRKIQINFVGLHPPQENTHTKRMRQESASKININHLVSSPIAGLTHSKSFTHTMCTQCVQTSKIFFCFSKLYMATEGLFDHLIKYFIKLQRRKYSAGANHLC